MINWSLFPAAINEYTKLGYSLIDVPWLVDKKSIEVTIPPGRKAYSLNLRKEKDKYLVGSAEQSFVYLALRNKLPLGKYMAMTPCFRDDEVDDLHQKYFMKLELIQFISSKINYHPNFHKGQMMRHARDVMSNFTKKSIVVQPTDDGTDLTINNIEIGSYGVRIYKNIQWIYGTGLAEPRFSIADSM